MRLSLAFDKPPQPADVPTRRNNPIRFVADPAQDVHSPAIESRCCNRYQQYQFSADNDEELAQHIFIVFLMAFASQFVGGAWISMFLFIS
jgi:hypothetical protein